MAARLRAGEPLPGRDFLHSSLAIGLRYSVIEIENIYAARLAHGTMVASLYGNPRSDVSRGGDHVNRLLMSSIGVIPYMNVDRSDDSAVVDPEKETEELVKRWEKLNAEYEASLAAESETGAVR